MRKIIAISIVFISLNLYGQNEQEHNLSGNLQLNYQTFQEDSTINAKAQKAYTSYMIGAASPGLQAQSMPCLDSALSKSQRNGTPHPYPRQ